MEHIDHEIELALRTYLSCVDSVNRPELSPGKDLQSTLTDPIHRRSLDDLNRLCTINTDQQRLQLLTTPHATTWTLNSPLFHLLPSLEFRCALRWILGIPQFNSNYICPGCRVSAVGVHAVTCTRSGDITRGHTVLRDTVLQIMRNAGFSAEPEQQLPDHPERRPADVLVTGWKGRTLAVDFTIVTPIRASSNLPASSSTTLLDQVAGIKLRQSQALCRAAGWDFHPFVADSFGALRCDSREFVSFVIPQRSSRFFPLSSASAGRAIWSTIAAAVVRRAAAAFARLKLINAPAGMPLNLLQLQTSCWPTTSFSGRSACEHGAGAMVGSSATLLSTGTNLLQPSLAVPVVPVINASVVNNVEAALQPPAPDMAPRSGCAKRGNAGGLV